ncbi:caveolin-3-like [Antedon mediterranea]|uniref:caveolin-3-like n=1 Tax=Antedon mediterranea TaxID=105859 RepID=UPI003AF8D758
MADQPEYTDESTSSSKDKSEKKKQKKQKKEKKEKEQTELVIPDDVHIDMNDRDPEHINEDVKVAFEDIFAEPEDLHSQDKTWLKSYQTFRGTKSWCYNCLTSICAIPAAFCWGLEFACLSFYHIWCAVPCLHDFKIFLKCTGEIWSICIHTFFDPCYSSVALTFSRINVDFHQA